MIPAVLTCTTCGRALDLAAAAESMAAVTDCCFAALRWAHSNAMVAMTTQAFVRSREQFRRNFDRVSSELVTSKDPEAREMAVAWRNARGKNLERARVVHIPLGDKWTCGATNDEGSYPVDENGMPAKPDCPYCLGVVALREIRL